MWGGEKRIKIFKFIKIQSGILRYKFYHHFHVNWRLNNLFFFSLHLNAAKKILQFYRSSWTKKTRLTTAGSGCISLAMTEGGTLRRYAVQECVSRKVRRPAGTTEISGCAFEVMAAFNGVTGHRYTVRHGTMRRASRLSKRIRASARTLLSCVNPKIDIPAPAGRQPNLTAPNYIHTHTHARARATTTRT